MISRRDAIYRVSIKKRIRLESKILININKQVQSIYDLFKTKSLNLIDNIFVYKMQDKFQNMYNRNSARLQSWDYSSDGIYFITICTKNRINHFGNIINGEMELTEEGKIVYKNWQSVPENFDFAEIGKFIVMPNHFHAILSITKNTKIHNTISKISEEGILNSTGGGFAGEKNPMLNDNVSKIVRWFKGKCTFEIRKENEDFSWQARFYDHIIRDELSLRNIENYIINNPANWGKDILK